MTHPASKSHHATSAQSSGMGLLVTLSAPSGTGKTSLVRALAERDPRLAVSVSHTTRPRRATEKEGINYHFIDAKRFAALVAAGGFLEHALVFGHHYGTAAESVRRERAAGRDVILEIDWQGAAQVRSILPDTVGIFVAPPSIDALRQRLVSRGEDGLETIQRRLDKARAELSHYQEYDYLVINDEFDTTLRDLEAILRAERLRCGMQITRQRELIDNLLD